MWKFPGLGINPHHSSDPNCCSDNPESLTCCTTRELLHLFIYSTLCLYQCGLMESDFTLWIIIPIQFLIFLAQIILALENSCSFSGALLIWPHHCSFDLFFFFGALLNFLALKEAIEQNQPSRRAPRPGALVPFIGEWY